MAAIVTAEGLRKSFTRRGSSGPPVLDGLDLELHEGEVLALLGPNGAGKSTTVRILSTLLQPDAGRATVAGLDVVSDARKVREIISLTGQQVAVDDKLTGAENLTMMGRLAHLPRRTVSERVAELLAAFDLTDAAGRHVGTWSGGMRRRLDLAAGLLNRPRIMFLDEPTTGLDPRSRQSLWDVVRGVVAEGTSVFLTTQYLEEADRLAQRVALVDGGRVVAEGTPTQLKQGVGDAGVELSLAQASDAARVLESFVGATFDGERLRVPTDGSVAHVRSILAGVEAAGVVPEHWVVRAPTLDDVFLTLTGHAGHRGAEQRDAARQRATEVAA